MEQSTLNSDRELSRLLLALVSYALGVPLDEVYRHPRPTSAGTFARQLAMYLAHVGLGMTQHRVAIAFERDRSTVAYACRVIESRRDAVSFDQWVEAFESLAERAPDLRVSA